MSSLLFNKIFKCLAQYLTIALKKQDPCVWPHAVEGLTLTLLWQVLLCMVKGLYLPGAQAPPHQELDPESPAFQSQLVP